MPTPSGTVTFLFTDVEGSTRLWEEHSRVMHTAMARHDAILRLAVVAHGGYVVKTTGDGLHAAFARAEEALQAALDAQRALAAEEWDLPEPLRARMGLHTGAAEERDGDYFGPAVNRAARVMAAAHGGQIILSGVTAGLLGRANPDLVMLRDLGEHRLKDLGEPERLFALTTPDLPSDFPPPRTLDSHPNNLPTQATPFVGRERELAEVLARLRRTEVRLLTLTGPGGTGKTRLALRTAAELIEEFADGIFFVPLEPVRESALVAPSILRALGSPETATRSAADLLRAHLTNRALMLVLDNLEQVPDAAGEIGALLAHAPRVKLLATSRASLRLRGEYEYPVPPLGLPENGALERSDAVRLFVLRAEAVRPGFALTPAVAATVAEICRRVDGLPLAIELAAARVKLLPPEALLQRLDRQLSLLVGGARDLPARQQTLRGAIDWSYRLLDTAEQRLLRRLGVFAGGFTLEGAEHVCTRGDVGDVFEAVGSLAEKSLLRSEGDVPEPRFGMLGAIRDFALEQLEASGEATEMRAAHARWVLDRAEQANLGRLGPDEPRWLDLAEREMENVRAALDHAEHIGDAELALRLSAASASVWRTRGYLRDALSRLERALGLPGADAPALARWRAQGLIYAANITMFTGRQDLARRACEEAVELAQTVGDPLLLGRARQALAWRLGPGEEATSVGLLEEALAAFRAVGAEADAATSLDWLGFRRDSAHETRAMQAEALAILRRVGSPSAIANQLNNFGITLWRLGEHDQALACQRESLAMRAALRDPRGVAAVLDCLGALAVDAGDARRTLVLAGAAAAIREPRGIAQPDVWQQKFNPAVERARALLDPIAAAAAHEEGRAMTLEAAVAYALGDQPG